MHAGVPLRISFRLDEIHEAAHSFWRWASGQRVIALSGSLGAGKTTFIHALCDIFGVQDAVSSPTFALINEYRFRTADDVEQVIFHMDWYRLNSLDEAIDAGMEDALQRQDAICFVEWPERAEALLRMEHAELRLTSESDDARLLEARVVSGE